MCETQWPIVKKEIGNFLPQSIFFQIPDIYILNLKKKIGNFLPVSILFFLIPEIYTSMYLMLFMFRYYLYLPMSYMRRAK